MQACSNYLCRFNEDWKGQWEPLDKESVRRGSLVKCVSGVIADSCAVPNVSSCKDSMARVLAIDEDGDVKLSSLSQAGMSDLWIPDTPNSC